MIIMSHERSHLINIRYGKMYGRLITKGRLLQKVVAEFSCFQVARHVTLTLPMQQAAFNLIHG